MLTNKEQALSIQRNETILEVILDPQTGQLEELVIRAPTAIVRQKKRDAFDGFYKTILCQSTMFLVRLQYQVGEMEAVIVLECGVHHRHYVNNRLSGRNSRTRK